MSTTRVKRPWGAYTVINKGKGFKVKVVEVLAGKRISLQRHNYRSEHWVVVEGKAKITNGRDTLFLKENESTFIPKKGTHRVENIGKKKLKIIEVQCGDQVKECDILRFEDSYGRV